MYFFDSFFYPFNSRGLFNRILIALVLSLIPIVGTLVLTGYGIKIIGEVYEDNDDLPSFELGADFGRGLITVIASIIYALPVIIVSTLLVAGASQPDGSLNMAILLLIVPLALLNMLVIVVAVVRFGITRDSKALMEVGRNISLAMSNPSAGILFFVNVVIYALFVFVATSIGLALFIIPGLIIGIAAQFGQYYLYAQYGFELEIGGARKVVVDNSYNY